MLPPWSAARRVQTKESSRPQENLNRGLGRRWGIGSRRRRFPTSSGRGLCVYGPAANQKPWMPRPSSRWRVAPRRRRFPRPGLIAPALIGHYGATTTISRKRLPHSENDAEGRACCIIRSERGQAAAAAGFDCRAATSFWSSSPEAFRRCVSGATLPALGRGRCAAASLALKDVRQYLTDRRNVLATTLASSGRTSEGVVGTTPVAGAFSIAWSGRSRSQPGDADRCVSLLTRCAAGSLARRATGRREKLTRASVPRLRVGSQRIVPIGGGTHV